MSDDAIRRQKTVAAGSAVDTWSGNAPLLSFQITIEDLAQGGTGVQVNILPDNPNLPPISPLFDIDPDSPLLPSGPHLFQVGPDGFQIILQAKAGADGQNCSVTYTFKWHGG
jgi:hypothetical protein